VTVPVGLIANEFLANSVRCGLPMGIDITRVAAGRIGSDRIQATFAGN